MRHARHSRLILAAAGTALAGPAHADVLLVPSEYPTIQAAIDAAIDGDLVLVADGTYTGDGNRDLDFGGRAITVESENGADGCVIDVAADAGDPHRAFRFHTGEGEDSVVRGFTVRNGFMDRGGAVSCEKGVSPLLDACVFEQNVAWTDSFEDGGGAIHVDALAGVTIQGCGFDQNHTEDVVGQQGGGAIRSLFGSSMTITGCVFESNSTASAFGSFGGAIYDSGGFVTLEGCTLTENSAVAGGAVTTYQTTISQIGCVYTGNWANFAGAAYDAMTFATYESCEFHDNFTVETGGDNSGGAYVANSTASVSMTDCVFTNNASAGNAGGGVGLNNAFIELVRCDLIGNSAARGGGVFGNATSVLVLEDCHLEGNIATDAGAGLDVRNNAESTVTGCVFLDNVAAASGGGINVRNNSSVTVTACDLRGNEAQQGGGARVEVNSEATFVNSLFADNSAGSVGGAIVASAGNLETADVLLVNATITENTANLGGAIAVIGFAVTTVTNSILWADVADAEITLFGSGQAFVTHSDVQGGWAGAGNQNVDPMFIDPAGGDYRILENLITDAGDNCAVPAGIGTDLAGDARFVDYPGAPDTGVPGCEGGDRIVDLGAYERQCPADCNGDDALNILDFVCFQGEWQAQTPAGDCDANGVYNILDFVCFQGAFLAGCQ